MPYNAVFDARQVQPKQGGGAHPVGNKFPFRITKTEVVPTKDNTGGLFAVELTSEAGSITNRYNLWNANDVARRIANEQLSALCHATGRFEVDFKNDGIAMMGGQGLMDIGFQKGHEPSAEKPEGGYVELKKVYTLAGLEPGATPPAQQTGNTAPANNANQQQPQQGQQTANQPAIQQGWGGNGQQQQPQTEQQPVGGQSWGTGGGAMPEKAPWGSQ